MEGKNEIFKADPNLSLDRKIDILENMLENEKNEKEERLKKVEINKEIWNTVREETAKLKKTEETLGDSKGGHEDTPE